MITYGNFVGVSTILPQTLDSGFGKKNKVCSIILAELFCIGSIALSFSQYFALKFDKAFTESKTCHLLGYFATVRLCLHHHQEHTI
jgi:nitrate/nitrite transporter NarK